MCFRWQRGISKAGPNRLAGLNVCAPADQPSPRVARPGIHELQSLRNANPIREFNSGDGEYKFLL
jgi:hypothetical protein